MSKKKTERTKPKSQKRSDVENTCTFKFVEVRAFDWTMDDTQMSFALVSKRMGLSEGWFGGYLVHEDDEKIVIAQQIFDNGSCRTCITISKATIIGRIDYE